MASEIESFLQWCDNPKHPILDKDWKRLVETKLELGTKLYNNVPCIYWKHRRTRVSYWNSTVKRKVEVECPKFFFEQCVRPLSDKVRETITRICGKARVCVQPLHLKVKINGGKHGCLTRVKKPPVVYARLADIGLLENDDMNDCPYGSESDDRSSRHRYYADQCSIFKSEYTDTSSSCDSSDMSYEDSMSYTSSSYSSSSIYGYSIGSYSDDESECEAEDARDIRDSDNKEEEEEEYDDSEDDDYKESKKDSHKRAWESDFEFEEQQLYRSKLRKAHQQDRKLEKDSDVDPEPPFTFTQDASYGECE